MTFVCNSIIRDNRATQSLFKTPIFIPILI